MSVVRMHGTVSRASFSCPPRGPRQRALEVNMRKYLAALLLLFCTGLWGAAQESAQPEKVVPAINQVELWQQVGQQPYEFTWTERGPDRHTLVDFEDMEGWKLELYDGAQGELRRSREQQLWGLHVAKIVYSGTRPQSRLVARPPQPIAIPEAFDCVELWAYGNHWSWESDPTTPRAEIAVLIEDARGKAFRIQMTDIQWKQWWLVHRRVPREVLNQIVWPARFTGIEISKGTNTEPRAFFCDNLAFYKEALNPLTFQPQPKRNLKPYRGEIIGTNTGPGTLPFPTREETILPANFEKSFKVSARETAPRHFEFRYDGRDATVVYEYRPPKGRAGRADRAPQRRCEFRPLGGGGVRFADSRPKECGGRRTGFRRNGRRRRGDAALSHGLAAGGLRAAFVAEITGAGRLVRGRRGRRVEFRAGFRRQPPSPGDGSLS